MPEPEAPSDALLRAFRALYESDRAAGRTRPLPEYLSLFPDAAVAVAGEYALLQMREEEAGPAPPAPLPGAVGPYRVVRELGRGGQGVVYVAEDPRLGREVALKVLRPDLAHPHLMRRFEHEAHILGQLRHPGIAQVYEAGAADTPLGRQPWFAMELIAGRPLDEHVAAHGLDRRARLDLVARVCDAVQHAHQKGVVHRDLKPGNVLVDETGQPKVLDFGIARAAGPAGGGTAPLTSMGFLIGTLASMSPEQVSGDPRLTDPRSDVYALGVILYQLLAGRLPLELEGCTVTEAARRIREVEPLRLGAIDPALRGDVETIVAKALEKERERRYPSAAALAEDLRRHLADQPILARPASAMYQLRKFARRHRAVVTGLATTLVALVAGIVATTWLVVLEARQADEARRARDRSEREAYRAGLGAALAAVELHDGRGAARALAAAPERLRGWEWRHLSWRADRSLWSRPAPRGWTVRCGGGEVRVLDRDGGFRAWDAADGRPIGGRRVIVEDPGPAFLDAEGARVLVSRPVALFETATGRRLWELEGAAAVQVAAFSRDGGQVAVADRAGTAIRVLEAATGRETASFPRIEPTIRALDFSPDGIRLACWYFDRGQLVEPSTGRSLWRGAGASGRFTSGGDVLVGGFPDRVVFTDAATGAERFRRAGAAGPVHAVATGPGGRVATGEGSSIVLRDPRGGEPVAVLQGHTGSVRDLAFSEDGSRLASVGDDGTVRLWDARTGPDPFFVPGLAEDPVGGVVLAVGDGRAWRGGWGWVEARDLDTGAPLWCRTISRRELHRPALEAGGRRLAVQGDGRSVLLLEAATGRTVATLGPLPSEIEGFAWLPGGRLAVGGRDGVVRLLDLDSGKVAQELPGGAGGVRLLQLAHDGARLASGALAGPDAPRGATRVWEAASGRLLRELPPGPDALTTLEWNARDGRLAEGFADGTIRLWSDDPARPPVTMGGSGTGVWSLAFSPDGTMLASAGQEAAIHLWDLEERVERLTLAAPTQAIVGIAWTGRTLVVSGDPMALGLFETGPPAGGFEARERVRAAEAVVRELSRKLVLSADVLRHLEADGSLDHRLRDDAIALARGGGDRLNQLNSEAWARVRHPDATPEESARARRVMEEVCRLWPDDWGLTNTLAAACLRAGDFEAARAAIGRCEALRSARGEASHPVDDAILAMALHGLGRAEEARAALDRAREGLRAAAYAGDAESRNLVREAEERVAPR